MITNQIEYSYVFLFIMLCYLIAITVSKKQEILKPKGIFNSMTWHICKFVKQVCLTKVTVSGLEKVKGQKMLVVSNHQSNIDPLLIISVLENMGLTFIMKESILKIPVVGRWLISAGFLSINRENNREGLKTIIRSIKRVENGYPIGVFPEGTRSKGPDMQEFKDGAFKIEGIDKIFEGTIDDTDDIANEIIDIIIQENLFHLAGSVDLNSRLINKN